MADSIIPDDVQQFILQQIDSIAQLEGLLLLRNNAPKKWGTDAIAHGLYISKSEATILVTRLVEQGFVVKSGPKTSAGYLYQPQSPELAEMATRIANLYRQYLVPITNLIHSKSKTRVQEFANAFKLRKD